MTLDRGLWITRCSARFLEILPDLTASDTEQLAASLWEIARFRALAPEAAADQYYSNLMQ